MDTAPGGLGLADAERALIDGLRCEARMRVRPGWAYAGLSGLLLAHGRLFTPAPLPPGTPPGEPGACYIESVLWARDSSGALAYVGFSRDTRQTGNRTILGAEPSQ